MRFLPSTRALARELGLSRTPVLDAFGQLHAEGYLETVIGSGTRVASRLASPAGSVAPARAHLRRLRLRLGAAPSLAPQLWLVAPSACTSRRLLIFRTASGRDWSRATPAVPRRVRSGMAIRWVCRRCGKPSPSI